MNTYQIKVPSEDRTVVGMEGESLLDTAIRTRVKIKVGCKGGGCGFCKIHVLDGELDLRGYSKSKLPDEEVEQGYVLACKAFPKTDVTIDYHNQPIKVTV